MINLVTKVTKQVAEGNFDDAYNTVHLLEQEYKNLPARGEKQKEYLTHLESAIMIKDPKQVYDFSTKFLKAHQKRLEEESKELDGYQAEAERLRKKLEAEN